MAEPGLPALQGWLQAAILAGGDPAAGEMIVGGNRLTAQDRLGIHARGYVLRLLEALRAEFGVLRKLAGDRVFDLFATAYIRATPPTSYTLYELGAGFAGYLAANRPGDAPDGPDAIPVALAKLDRARAEVHRARGLERAGAPDPMMGAILAMAPDAALYRPDSVRLLDLPFDVTETVAAADRDAPPPLPVPGRTLLAVSRMRYQVRCHRLEPWQHDWLSALPDEPGASRPGITAAPDGLFGWLPGAMAAGLAACGDTGIA